MKKRLTLMISLVSLIVLIALMIIGSGCAGNECPDPTKELGEYESKFECNGDTSVESIVLASPENYPDCPQSAINEAAESLGYPKEVDCTLDNKVCNPKTGRCEIGEHCGTKPADTILKSVCGCENVEDTIICEEKWKKDNLKKDGCIEEEPTDTDCASMTPYAKICQQDGDNAVCVCGSQPGLSDFNPKIQCNVGETKVMWDEWQEGSEGDCVLPDKEKEDCEAQGEVCNDGIVPFFEVSNAWCGPACEGGTIVTSGCEPGSKVGCLTSRKADDTCKSGSSSVVGDIAVYTLVNICTAGAEFVIYRPIRACWKEITGQEYSYYPAIFKEKSSNPSPTP